MKAFYKGIVAGFAWESEAIPIQDDHARRRVKARRRGKAETTGDRDEGDRQAAWRVGRRSLPRFRGVHLGPLLLGRVAQQLHPGLRRKDVDGELAVRAAVDEERDEHERATAAGRRQVELKYAVQRAARELRGRAQCGAGAVGRRAAAPALAQQGRGRADAALEEASRGGHGGGEAQPHRHLALLRSVLPGLALRLREFDVPIVIVRWKPSLVIGGRKQALCP